MIVTFGEIMGRLNPIGFQRIQQTLPGTLKFTFAGAEANVAVSVANYGAEARFVTSLPTNVIAEACIQNLRGLGVDTGCIVRHPEGRLGLYFVEAGANQRPSQVVYDRDGSAISVTASAQYEWQKTLAGGDWLHLSGITPAISKLASEATITAAQTAQQMGLTVSCDLNFRKKLWRWDNSASPHELAGRTMREILPFVDVVIANEADCQDVLGIKAAGTDVESGKLSIERYPEVARQVVQQFPNVQKVAITLRESHSASHNDWGGMLYDAADSAAFFAPKSENRYRPYEIRNIVDRVGAGDSFAAGLIFAQSTPELSDSDTSLRFAAAASCLAHTIEGDFNFSTRAEVESLMGGATSGRVIR